MWSRHGGCPTYEVNHGTCEEEDPKRPSSQATRLNFSMEYVLYSVQWVQYNDPSGRPPSIASIISSMSIEDWVLSNREKFGLSNPKMLSQLD